MSTTFRIRNAKAWTPEVAGTTALNSRVTADYLSDGHTVVMSVWINGQVRSLVHVPRYEWDKLLQPIKDDRR
jgi:hypothetical protein